MTSFERLESMMGPAYPTKSEAVAELVVFFAALLLFAGPAVVLLARAFWKRHWQRKYCSLRRSGHHRTEVARAVRSRSRWSLILGLYLAAGAVAVIVAWRQTLERLM